MDIKKATTEVEKIKKVLTNYVSQGKEKSCQTNFEALEKIIASLEQNGSPDYLNYRGKFFYMRKIFRTLTIFLHLNCHSLYPAMINISF